MMLTARLYSFRTVSNVPDRRFRLLEPMAVTDDADSVAGIGSLLMPMDTTADQPASLGPLRSWSR